MAYQPRFRGNVPSYSFDETQQAIKHIEDELKYQFGRNRTVPIKEDYLRVVMQYIKHLENELVYSTEKVLVLPEPKDETPHKLRVDWR